MVEVPRVEAQAQCVRAAEIATNAHEGQLDKTGGPYLGHCQRVAENVAGAPAKTVAYLHDILEKSAAWDIERLRQEGFSSSILDAVLALTRREHEDEETFIARACSSELSTTVKRADLEDNLSQARSAGLDTRKYRHGLKLLEGHLLDKNAKRFKARSSIDRLVAGQGDSRSVRGRKQGGRPRP
ncbi:hypothetical protein LPJGGPFB_05147 [Ensifer adhaerens]|nr:hypothetical protein [Ensifer adhaerens]